MDAKQIVEKSKALQKATAQGESPAGIIRILNELKSGVKPTADLLRSTKIGKRTAEHLLPPPKRRKCSVEEGNTDSALSSGIIVNKSKQSKSPEVAQLASEIVKKWRDDVQPTKGSPTLSHKGSPVLNGKPSAATPPTSQGSPAPTVDAWKSTVPLEQRDWKKDKIDIKRTGQSTRDSCVGLFYNGLCYCSSATPNTIISVAVACEQATFDKCGPESNAEYKAKVRSLFQNLKIKSNPGLREGVVNGGIDPTRFVNMTNDELKSAERRAEETQMQKENLRDAQVPMPEKSISNALQCGKCGQKKVSYSQAQTRSADEPMTTFCECTNCGKRWKVNDDMFSHEMD